MQPGGDKDLQICAQRGDQKAYGKSVRQNQQAAVNVYFRLMNNRQSEEDLSQESFLRAYQ